MSALLRGPGLSLSVVPVKVMRGSLYHRLSAVSDAIEWEGALREMGASRCICCMFLFFTLVASCALSGLLSQACQITLYGLLQKQTAKPHGITPYDGLSNP